MRNVIYATKNLTCFVEKITHLSINRISIETQMMDLLECVRVDMGLGLKLMNLEIKYVKDVLPIV